jgi:hypothetical protein
VDAFSVVVVQPRVKCRRSFGVAGIWLGVGPFGGQGPVESLDLAVGPRAVRVDEPLFGIQLCDGCLESGGLPVGEGVVGDDAYDCPDALCFEECGGSEEEAGRGRPFLIGVDFGVGQTAAVIDGGVDVVESNASPADLLRPAVGAPAPAVRDPSDFSMSVKPYSWCRMR